MPPSPQSPARVMSRVLFPVLALFVALMIAAPLDANAQTTGTTASPAKRVAPPGYTLRFSPTKQAPAATRTRATVSCPKGTGPLSGGAFVQDEDLLVNLSDSFPSGSAWVVDIDNA